MEHGLGGYTNHRCRCSVCRKASAEYQKTYQVEYRRKNHDRQLGYVRAYNKRNKEKLRNAKCAREASRRAKKRDQFIEDVDPLLVFVLAGGKCGICGLGIEGPFQMDHIVPLARGGMHAYENMQAAHPYCNASKGAGCPPDVRKGA